MRKSNSQNLAELQELKQREQIRLEFISSYAVYLVPLIPAILSFFDIRSYITWSEEIPVWMIYVFGIISGAILEFLGLASSHTYAAFNVHNRTAGKTQKVKVFWVFIAWGFYLVTMLALNVGLPWSHISTEEKIARAALSVLSIPVFILVSIRSTHAQILLKKEEDRLERLEKKQAKKRKQETIAQPVVQSNGHSPTSALEVFLEQSGMSPFDFGRGGESIVDLANELGVDAGGLRTALHRKREELKESEGSTW